MPWNGRTSHTKQSENKVEISDGLASGRVSFKSIENVMFPFLMDPRTDDTVSTSNLASVTKLSRDEILITGLIVLMPSVLGTAYCNILILDSQHPPECLFPAFCLLLEAPESQHTPRCSSHNYVKKKKKKSYQQCWKQKGMEQKPSLPSWHLIIPSVPHN